MQGDTFKMDTELLELSSHPGSPDPSGMAGQPSPSRSSPLATGARSTPSLRSRRLDTTPPEVWPHDPPNSFWAEANESFNQHDQDVITPSHAREPYLLHPPPAHTATPLLSTHDIEGDPWPINQYITSDPRFRDSTLVFPRIHQHSVSSWPFWKRHRVTILTTLASLVALGFFLVAIIGSVMVKND
ncbi:hypothetical protein CTheo_841 [Ceratobasidium theobromae]|uniref:Transmembrane protein n=1 Tax=Ceratobasidium theobromae TaxID=1582974 RepID=A0A5N5QVX1_9AGAM|nr:hypothetical protein CTheo_841 [Ceratobasidium theobromae]